MAPTVFGDEVWFSSFQPVGVEKQDAVTQQVTLSTEGGTGGLTESQ